MPAFTGFQRICVYCGSSSGSDEAYCHTARQLGEALAQRNIELVYGGSRRGLMGHLANAVLSGGGRVTGVIPQNLVDLEIAHEGLTTLHVVNSMHERKATMTELADGFIVMPGAWGTLDELCEAATWAQLGIHRKPIGVLNVNGYWNLFFDFLQHAVTKGFLRPAHYDVLLVSESVPDLLDKMEVAQDHRAALEAKVYGFFCPTSDF